MHIRAAVHAEKIAKEKGCKEKYVGQDGCYRGSIKYTYLIGDTYYKFNESGVLLISFPSKAAMKEKSA